MPAERLSMRRVREVLRLKYACGASVRTIARSVGIGHTTVGEYLRRTAVIGITWPVPVEIDDAELERRLFTPAGFDQAPARAMPDWNHVHVELRRRGVTLLLLWEEYRAEHRDGYGYSRFCDLYGDWRRGVSADDAPDPPRRREAVRGLCRRHCAGVRRDDRGGAARARVRRRARRLELHLCGGALERRAGRLDRRPCQRARLPRRHAAAAGLRQSAGRGDGRVPLRARHQPHLPGHGRPLRRRRAADPGPPPTRQGQGRGGGADRRALHPGAPAPPAVLLAGRAERGDPWPARRPQCPADAQARRQPPGVLRGDRPAGAAAVAGGALRLRRVAALPCRARLPRRSVTATSTRCRRG